jgi:hypothetical protein
VHQLLNLREAASTPTTGSSEHIIAFVISVALFKKTASSIGHHPHSPPHRPATPPAAAATWRIVLPNQNRNHTVPPTVLSLPFPQMHRQLPLNRHRQRGAATPSAGTTM